MTAGVCMWSSANLPSSPHSPSLVLLVPATDAASWALQHRRGDELLEDVLES